MLVFGLSNSPFCLVLGPYWTTSGLRLPVFAAPRPLTPCNRLRGTGVLVRFVARIPDLIGREEMNLECIGCAGSQPFEFRVYLAGSLIQELRFPSVPDRPLQHLSVGINSLQSRLCRQSANCVRPLMV